jgi:hypothetical protein
LSRCSTPAVQPNTRSRKPRPEDTESLTLSQVLEDEYRFLYGASRCPEERRRLFNPLTGFDPLDNESMCNLRFDDVRLSRALYENHLADARRLVDGFVRDHLGLDVGEVWTVESCGQVVSPEP